MTSPNLQTWDTHFGIRESWLECIIGTKPEFQKIASVVEVLVWLQFTKRASCTCYSKRRRVTRFLHEVFYSNYENGKDSLYVLYLNQEVLENAVRTVVLQKETMKFWSVALAKPTQALHSFQAKCIETITLHQNFVRPLILAVLTGPVTFLKIAALIYERLWIWLTLFL